MEVSELTEALKDLVKTAYGDRVGTFKIQSVDEATSRARQKARSQLSKEQRLFIDRSLVPFRDWLIERDPEAAERVASGAPAPQDIETAVSNSKAGQIQYKNDKAGIVHAGIGKLNFSEDDLLENLKTFYSSITKSKPDAVKGSFIKKVSIASTMGFGLEINSSLLR